MKHALAVGCSLAAFAVTTHASANNLMADPGNSTASSAGLVISPATDPVVQAAFNSDEKVASLTGTFNIGSLGRLPGSGVLTISAQTPIAQGQTYVNTATLDGLTKSTSLSVSLTWFSGGFSDDSYTKLLKRENQTTCRNLIEETKKNAPPGGVPPAAGVQPLTCYESLVQDAAKARTDADLKYLGSINPDQPTPEQIDQLKKNQEVEAEITRLQRALHKSLEPTPAATWELSLNGKVGYEEHDYYDPATLAQVKSDKTPWQVGGSVGYVFASGDMSLHAAINYQESFVDGGTGTPQTKCLPSLTCATGFIGAPILQDKALISGDFRWLTDDFAGLKFPLGVAPKFTYDAVAGSEAVQVPIYLVSGSDNKLSGGIRYDWTSTTHISTVGVFVSAAFSVL